MEDTMRITTRKATERGQPSGLILTAVSTTWLPRPYYKVFDLLRDERRRYQLDMLSNGNPLQEMAHIPNGSHPGNCISLIRVNVITLDMGLLVAGTKYCGEFEERLKKLMEGIKQSDDTILFIDEVYTLIGAGVAEGAIDDDVVAAAELSHQYISDRFLPDKAIDLINEVGSCVRLRHAQVGSIKKQWFSAIYLCNRAADCNLAIALDVDYMKAISRRANLHEKIRDYVYLCQRTNET